MEILNEIIKNACGKNEKGKSNSAITMECAMWPVEDDEDEENIEIDDIEQPEPRSVGLRSTHNPIIEIEKHNDLFQVDIIFNSYIDADLRFFWNLLEKYGDLLNSINDESVEIPALTLTAVPAVYDGMYYILCINPMFWALQPQTIGGDVNVIRLVFDAEDVGIFESNEIDIEEIKSEVDREVANKEAMYSQMLEKENEYAQRLSDRNERIEKMRGYSEIDEYEDNNNDDDDDIDAINENSDDNNEKMSDYSGNSRYKII